VEKRTLVARPCTVPNGGVADSLDEAKAAFWAAGERQRRLPGEADVIPAADIVTIITRDQKGEPIARPP
jgi:hypothetical protein